MRTTRYWFYGDRRAVRRAARRFGIVCGEVRVSWHLRPTYREPGVPDPPRRVRGGRTRPWPRHWRWEPLALFHLRATPDGHARFVERYIHVPEPEPPAPVPRRRAARREPPYDRRADRSVLRAALDDYAADRLEGRARCRATTVEYDGSPTRCALPAGHVDLHNDGAVLWSDPWGTVDNDGYDDWLTAQLDRLAGNDDRPYCDGAA